MAKELPYFKFEPNQWENGNIQMFNRELKGLFIDLCSMYWSRLGDLPFKLAVQKLCAGNAGALMSLCDEEIFEVIDGMICIGFLNEQLQEFENVSNKASESAKARWEKHRKQKDSIGRNAIALNSHCDNDAIRGEERREEKRREETISPSADASASTDPVFDFKKGLVALGVSSETAKQWLQVRKKKKATNTEIAFQKVEREIATSGRSADECIRFAVEMSWAGFQWDWMLGEINKRSAKQTAGSPARQTHLNSGDNIDFSTQSAK